MCECYQIGGPWIDVDPDCPIHNTSHRDYIDRDEMDRLYQENSELRAKMAQKEEIISRYFWLRDKIATGELVVAEEIGNELTNWSSYNLDRAIDQEIHSDLYAKLINWEPSFSKWRHGGWYVNNIQYASGSCGCVSNNYPDKKWRIVCDNRRVHLNEPGDFTFKSRHEAALAEYILILKDAKTK